MVCEPDLIVVDWTSSILEIAVFDRGGCGYELRSSFTLPTRVALRQNAGGEISYLFGAAIVDEEEEHTILFRHPGRDLPKIDDVDLQTALLTAVWRGLHQSLISEGLLSPGQVASVYLIPRAQFTPPLLEQLRRCASQTSLRLCSTITSATALVMGALGLAAFVEDLSLIANSKEITAGCFVLREEILEGVCFYYETAGPNDHRIVIRDHFHVRRDALSQRLSETDCSNPNVGLVLEASESSASAKGKNVAFMEQVAGAGQWRHLQWPAEVSLKLMGCAETASFAAGESTNPARIEISHVYNLGIQINQSRFHPLISSEQLKSARFPTAGSQSFRLSRNPGDELRLNFCGGYSTGTADSVSLGRVQLSHSELNAITTDTFLAASIRLDTPSSGEFFLGLMPENRILRQQSFMLPVLA